MATTARVDEKKKEFLNNPYVGIVTTLREDGSPHSTVVWVDVEDDGTIAFNTAAGRAKPRHLEKDPRVALLVVDPKNAYQWVAISGRAEMTADGADGQIDRLAKKYLGKDEYPWRNPAEQRLSVKIRPEHVDSSGFDD
jgi:PPOX class probable F420-dependent enzyme